MLRSERVITLDGIALYGMEVSWENPWKADYVACGAMRLDYHWRVEPEVNITARLMFHGREEIEAFGAFLHGWRWGCEWSLVTLGSGYICPYCGQYNPAGKIGCWACGGEVAVVPFVRPVQWPRTYISDWRIDATVNNDVNVGQIEMVTHGLDMEKHIMPLVESRTIETLQHGLRMTGYYLCEFCGASVEEGRPCPYCGGYQLPWSELVKIDRNCVYCGSHIECGVVCKSCGAKLAGLTYRLMKRRALGAN